MARHEVPTPQDRVEYAALEGLLKTLRVLPRSTARAGAVALVQGLRHIAPVRRRVALENLRLAFPERNERDIRGIYGRMWSILAWVLADFARFPRGDSDPILDTVELAGEEFLEQAASLGKGIMVLTGHFGNWEGMAAAVRARGYAATAIGARQRNPLVEDLFTRYREARGVRALTVGESLRPLLQGLRRGEVVGTLADQDGGRDGFFIDFLGRPASVQSGVFRLLARTRVPLVTAFTVRVGDGWRVEMQEPLRAEPTDHADATEAEAYRLAGTYTRRLEVYVRRHPDHWFWLHRRWRTRPPAAAQGEPEE